MPLSGTTSQKEDGKVEIATDRLLLRAARETDVPSVHEFFSDPEVMRYWSVASFTCLDSCLFYQASEECGRYLLISGRMQSTIPHDHVSQTHAWLQKRILSPTNGTSNFLIVLRSDPEHAIGTIGIDEPQSHELGFILSRRHWGAGIAQEAVDGILSHLFGSMAMEEVIAEVEPSNLRCLKFLKKHGFAVSGFSERMWQVSSVWWDSTQLKLRRESWEERQCPAEQGDS